MWRLGMLTLAWMALSGVATGAELHLKTCFNLGAKVHFLYPQCIRANFETLEERYPLKLQKCYNLPSHVTDAWVDCVNQNFKTLEDTLHISLKVCENPGWNLLFSSFPGCVRDNFSTIEKSANGS